MQNDLFPVELDIEKMRIGQAIDSQSNELKSALHTDWVGEVPLEHFIGLSVHRLIRLKRMDAPTIILETERRLLVKRINKLAPYVSLTEFPIHDEPEDEDD